MNVSDLIKPACLVCLALMSFGARADGGLGVRLPAFERVTLANGTELVLMEKHDTPLVSLRAVVRGGALGDPVGKDGTASLFADLTQKGAGTRDSAQFAEAIESAGGTLEAGAGPERLTVYASFMAKDADLMIGLVADALMRPRLAPDEFAKARSLAIQSIAAAKDSDPRALIGEYGDAWLFHGHPYGRSVDGSESTLATVTLDDVQRYYAGCVGGDRLILVVVGDFSAADMRRKLEAAFGSWRKAGAALPDVVAAARLQGRRVLLVDKPGATQTYFWLGNVGASRTDPARTSQSVVNTVFGGRYTSMLMAELRIKSGLTYDASSGFDRSSQPGAFSIGAYTQTEKTTDAIDLALATLDRLHKDGLDAAALASSQSYLLGQFPPSIETNGQLAGRLADLAFYGLGPEDVDQFAARVQSVDAAIAKATTAAAFPSSQDLAIVLIGDATKIREAVKKYGPVTEMKLDDPQFYPAKAR
jgi:predicted Zn-dependent peptidase